MFTSTDLLQNTVPRPAVDRRSPLAIAALAGGTLLVLEAIASVDIRRREMLIAYMGVFALAAAWALPALRALPRPGRIAIPTGFLLSLGLLPAAAVFSASPGATLVDGLFPTLSGWIALLIVLRAADPESVTSPAEWQPRGVHLVLLFATAALLLTVVHAMSVGAWAKVGDEVIYLVQSRWMNLSGLTWRMDPEIADFFRHRKVEYLDGQVYGMYPPGWPALLALFRGVGLEWWSGIVLGTASVALTWFIARRLHGPTAGLMAAVLMATSQQFLIAHAGYMSHAPSICALLGAVLCLLVSLDENRSRRPMFWIAAGVLLGYAVTVRPLTGLAMGTAIGLWTLLRLRGASIAFVARLGAFVLLGTLIPGLLLLAHNHAVYGELLAVGHSKMSGSVYNLGFGPRGITVLDDNLVRVPYTSDFTPAISLGHLLRRAVGVNTAYLPIGLLAPLVAAGVGFGCRLRWSAIAAFSVLPLACFFYWAGGLRHYTELLPFILIGVAGMLACLRRSRPRFALALFATLVAASAIMSLPWPRRDHSDGRRWSEYDYGGPGPVPAATFVRADSLAREHGRILLFSRGPARFGALFSSLYLFNGDRFDGPVLVARDRGPLNNELISRFPDRVPYLVIERGSGLPAEFRRIDGAAGGEATQPEPEPR